MKGSNRFIIGFIAAAVTFASLIAFVGPKRFAQYRQHCHENSQRWNNGSEQPATTQPDKQ
jgi:hypothetical protein